MDDVPVLRRDVGHAPTKPPEDPLHDGVHSRGRAPRGKCRKTATSGSRRRRRVDLRPRRPGDPLELVPDLAQEQPGALEPAAGRFPCTVSIVGVVGRHTSIAARSSNFAIIDSDSRRDWQARRESNPQPPVLETGALPIELLAYICRLQLRWQLPMVNPRSDCNLPIASIYFVSLCACACDRSGRTC